MKLLRAPTMGFYDVERAKRCPLSAFGIFLGIGVNLPRELPTRPILVGLFFHTLMEKDTSKFEGNQDYDFCEDQVRKLEKTVLENPRLKWMGSPSTWKEINTAANAFLANGFKSTGSVKSQRISKLSSKSGMLTGRPDFLRITGDSADLWEFKSANIYSEGNTVEKYLRQIFYYAYLIFQTFEVKRVNGRIVGLTGHESPKEILRKDAEQIGLEYENIIQSIVQKIDDASSLEDLAVPGLPQCLECSIRSECPSFLRVQYENEAFNSFRVIRGVLNTVSVNGTNIVLDISGRTIVILPILGINISEMEALLNQSTIVTHCRTSSEKVEATYRSQIIKTNGEPIG